VPGSCISNPKSSNIPDPNCPEGMHWRNTYELKANCVKVSKPKIKKKRTVPDEIVPAKTSCERQDVEPLFEKHKKLIFAHLEEYFTVPITKADFIKRPEVFRRVKKQFVKSIQKKLEDKNCEYRPSVQDNLALDSYIALLVDAFNFRFLTPKKWEFIKKVAENDVMLFMSRMVVKFQPYKYSYTLHYLDKLHELREALLYMNDNNLLPKQNTLIGRAYHNYIVQFFDKDNIFGIYSVHEPPPVEVRRENQKSLLEKVIALGYLNVTNEPRPTSFVDTVPPFVVPSEVLAPTFDGQPVVWLDTDGSTQGMGPVAEVVDVFGTETGEPGPAYHMALHSHNSNNNGSVGSGPVSPERPSSSSSSPSRPKYGESVEESSGYPTVLLVQSDGESVATPHTFAVRPSILQQQPNTSVMTDKEMQELYELYILFEQTYNRIPSSTLTTRGESLRRRYNELFNKLYQYTGRQLSAEKLLNYIENFGESEGTALSFNALEAKYGGPFWSTESMFFHCPRCNSFVKLNKFYPNEMVQCPVCRQRLNPAVFTQ